MAELRGSLTSAGAPEVGERGPSARSVGAPASLVGAIRTHAERAPDAPAVRDGVRKLSYAELWKASDEAAAFLRKGGVGAEDVVAVRTSRSVETVAVLLGIWKRHAAYLPLDGGWPPVRARGLVADAAAIAVVTDDDGVTGWSAQAYPVADVLDTVAPAETPARPPHPDGLAYMIGTSGSSGRPKIVAVPHGGVANAVAAFGRRLALSSEDVVLWSTTIAFDIAALEIWMPLAHGATVAIAANGLLAAGDLARELEELGVTLVQATPSGWRMLKEARWTAGRVRAAICGGETVPADLARWLLHTVPVALNAYGPTETTIWSAAHRLARSDAAPVPVGRPIDETQIYVLDGDMEPVPVGELGDVYIGGRGVTRGYVGRPGLTAERFRPNPFAAAGSRVYETGDRGYFAPDGNLLFAGRADRQAKIHGHRVELDEVQDALLLDPAVADAFVDTVDGRDGSAALVAHVVPRGDLLADAIAAAAAEQTRAWQETFEASFETGWASGDGDGDGDGDRDLALTGWVESATGKTFRWAEMEAWRDAVVGAVAAFGPERVLELGAGGGLIASALAPRCREYVATDLARSAVERLSRALGASGGAGNVRVEQMVAHELGRYAPGAFDAVVLTSVVQYFPSEDYLRRVLEDAITVLPDGGVLFVADVRDLDLLAAYALWRELAGPSSDPGSLAQRVAHRTRDEPQLVVAPRWFEGFADGHDRVRALNASPSRARVVNELTKFRYDVTIVVGAPTAPTAQQPPRRDWATEVGALDALGALAVAPASAVLVTGIPNRRVWREMRAARALLAAEAAADVDGLLASAELGLDEAVDPADVVAAGAEHGLDVVLSRAAGDSERFDALLVAREDGPADPRRAVELARRRRRPGRVYAGQRNVIDPSVRLGLQELGKRLLPEVRARLGEQLPEYMLPGRVMLLDRLPLMENGKVDQRALRSVSAASSPGRAHEPPRGEVERALAQMWANVLAVAGEVGRDDGFFELGGHSVAAARLAVRVRERFGVDFAISSIFERPRLRDLAAHVEALAATAHASAMPPIRRVPRVALDDWPGGANHDVG